MNLKLCNDGKSVVGIDDNGRNVSFSIESEEYKQWVSEGNTPEPEFTDAELLSKAKSEKLISLEKSCEDQIISGFASSAIGSEHWYKSELTDQMNLVGAASIGADTPFKAGVKDVSGVIIYDWAVHTAAQLKQVMSDGAAYKLQLLQKLTILKAQVNVSATLAEAEAVVW